MNVFLVTFFLLVYTCRADDPNKYQASFRNGSNQTIRPMKSYEMRSLELKTDEDHRIAKSLTRYFVLRKDCPFELDKYESNSNGRKFCPSKADYLLCFPSTPANQTVYFKCPYRPDLRMRADAVGNATRHCGPNGTWESTNYALCIKNAVLNQIGCGGQAGKNGSASSQLGCEEHNHAQDQYIYKMLALFNFIGFCVTVVFVSFAIFIFLSIRSLRCTRNMIHCNMLFTFMFKSTTNIAFYIYIVTKKHIDYKHSDTMCVVFNVLLNYSIMCSFFWMMIEAVYLITVIVAAYSSNKIKLWWYLIVGWALPLIPIIPYSVMTFKENSTCSWIDSTYNPPYEIMIDIPIYVLLVTNCILLILILYVIISKLKTHNDAIKTKYIQYKKLTRAALVLFPLFGLTFAVCFYLPKDPTTLFSKIYYFVNVFLQTTQGVWVAFVYCFLNDEVKNAIKTKLRSWKISHISSCLGSKLVSLSATANRNHSYPTIYSTQITHQGSIMRKREETLNPNDPCRVPILPLQEDKV